MSCNDDFVTSFERGASILMEQAAWSVKIRIFSVLNQMQGRHAAVTLSSKATDAAGGGLLQQEMALVQALAVDLGTAVDFVLG